MAKIRHIALATQDPAKTAEFYKAAFGFREVRRSKDLSKSGGVFLTDGTLGIAILKFDYDQLGKGLDYVGLHHFGVLVDDTDEWSKHLEDSGAEPFASRTDAVGQKIVQPGGGDFEVKFYGPDGVVFDISSHGWPGSEPVAAEDKKVPSPEPATVK